MTCKDCVHYEPCLEWATDLFGADTQFPYKAKEGEKLCDHFKPKSRFVELPCEVGQTVYKIFGEKIWEMRAVAIPLLISNCVSHMSVTAQNYRGAALTLELGDFGKTVFLSREEAEKALAERSK